MRGMVPDFLTHYYSAARGPFTNLSDLPPAQAEAIQEQLRREGRGFAGRRAPDYLTVRRGLEQRIRDLFVARGGRLRRAHPHYMILGACAWVLSWYPDGCELRMPLAAFPPDSLSFTYGDSFPAMRFADGKPYRGQVYTLADLPELIARYGLPQEWNADGHSGPERYIEAQVWDDAALAAFLPQPARDRAGVIQQ